METSNKSNSPDIQTTNNNTDLTNNKAENKNIEISNKFVEDQKDKNNDKYFLTFEEFYNLIKNNLLTCNLHLNFS